MDAVSFAFEVYKHREQIQPQTMCPTFFMNYMLVEAYISALLIGAMRAANVRQDENQSLTALLELLDKFLPMWTTTCGLDFARGLRYHHFGVGKNPPLVVCWTRKKENGMPVVDYLMKHGYKPSSWLAQSHYWYRKSL
jgi:hypothetical protein